MRAHRRVSGDAGFGPGFLLASPMLPPGLAKARTEAPYSSHPLPGVRSCEDQGLSLRHTQLDSARHILRNGSLAGQFGPPAPEASLSVPPGPGSISAISLLLAELLAALISAFPCSCGTQEPASLCGPTAPSAPKAPCEPSLEQLPQGLSVLSPLPAF